MKKSVFRKSTKWLDKIKKGSVRLIRTFLQKLPICCENDRMAFKILIEKKFPIYVVITMNETGAFKKVF